MEFKLKIAGRAKIYGDNVNTDVIHNPSKFTIDREKLSADLGLPESRSKKKGVIIVAGENFGVGSSRYSTVIALKNSGVLAVVAPSLSRIFKRNLACAGIFAFEAGPGGLSSFKIKDGDVLALESSGAPDGSFYRAGLSRAPEGKTIAKCAAEKYLFEVAAFGGMVKYLEKSGR